MVNVNLRRTFYNAKDGYLFVVQGDEERKNQVLWARMPDKTFIFFS